jgi:hypothetical protein
MLDNMTIRPERNEAASYYFTYIDQVGSGDICDLFDAQRVETVALLRGISDERSLYRYAPDKWTIREVMGLVRAWVRSAPAELRSGRRGRLGGVRPPILDEPHRRVRCGSRFDLGVLSQSPR